MNLHLTSIIPLTVGLVLLILGLVFNLWLILGAWLLIPYGTIIHMNNVAVVRKATRLYYARDYR